MSAIMMNLRLDIDPGVYPWETVMQINENITNGKVMEIVKNHLVNVRGNIADWNVNQDSKTPVVMMKGINYIGNSTEYPEAGVHLNLQ